MRWPWPPAARKFSVRLVVRRAEGLDAEADARLAVEVKWKGPKARWKGIRVCRNRTRLEAASSAASVEWEEEFEDMVTLTAASHRRKEPSAAAASFHPWDLCFSVLNWGLMEADPRLGSREEARNWKSDATWLEEMCCCTEWTAPRVIHTFGGLLLSISMRPASH